ncbi:MAG: DUF1707 domain-containing protein [Propionibacterium sp.]|nr:DUF1707 domain-containing protein [Propionibacterium sp.]
MTAVQRDHAASILREAVADGRLSVEELNARLGTALNAHAREDLYRILDDLIPAAELHATVALNVPMGDGPGMSWENPLLIRSNWAGHTREGEWDLPPFIEIIGTGWGSVKLDCTLARPLMKVIDVVITGNPGMNIIVPDGWGVDVQQLNVSGQSGTINSRVPTRPTGGMPRMILRGSTTMPVHVRNPSRRQQRALARRQQQAITAGP